MIDLIFDGFLLVIASAIYGLLGESWLNYIKFAEMPSTFTALTTAVIAVMMLKVIVR